MCLLRFVAFCWVFSFGKNLHAVGGGIPGYYWRDYTGEIPEDALPGGMENGSTTLIGQVLHKELLIPAKIILDEKRAYYEWGFAEHSTTENIKVLCTNHADQFEWVKTTSHDFRTIQNKNFIIGGYEGNAKLHIGRTYSQGEVVLGKVLLNPLTHDDVVLHISKAGRGIPTFLFEVLAFNDNKSSWTNIDSKIVINPSSTCAKKPVTIKLFC